VTHEVFINITAGTAHASPDIDAAAPEMTITVRSQQALRFGFFEIKEPFGISGEADTDVISAPGHTLSNGDRVTFPVLTGGYGLTAGTTPYIIRDATAGQFKVALTASGPAVNFTTDITSGTCRHAPPGMQVEGWISGRCAFKQYPESAVLLLDVELIESGEGAETRYGADWTHLTNDGTALRAFIKGQTLPRACWCEVEWTDGAGTHRANFPALIRPAFISPDEGAPAVEDPASEGWLTARALRIDGDQALSDPQIVQALENVGITLNAETGRLTFHSGHYIDLNAPES
jgi:hypothetical protein